MSIRGKLIALFVVIKVLPLIALGWVAWIETQNLGRTLADRSSSLTTTANKTVTQVGKDAIADSVTALDERARNDIERLTTRILYGSATPREVYALADTCARLPEVKRLAGDCAAPLLTELADRITVFIHPRTVRLDTLNAGVPRDLEGQPSGQIVDDDLDFYGLREYEPGDDVRNVHWLSSAKTGTLMIRQYEATRRTDTSVTISVNPDEYVNGEEFEMAVSIHSSIGVKCLLQDRPLFCHAGNAHGQPRNAMEFLDNASAIEPDREDNPNLAEGTLKHSPDASFYFFTVGSLKDIEQIKRMTLALPRSASCVVLQASAGANRGIRRFANFTLATIGDLDDLPLIMGVLA